MGVNILERMSLWNEEEYKNYNQKQTDLSSDDWRSWQLSAFRLSRSAKIIWKQVEEDWESRSKNFIEGEYNISWEDFKANISISNVFMLIAGLALENYLKAVCIAKNGQFNKQLKTHDFVKLVNLSQINFSTKEEELIERLECFVIFAGRYPAPLHSKDLTLRNFKTGGQAPLKMITGGDFDLWIKIIEKIENELEQK